jgi:hypothetical protein
MRVPVVKLDIIVDGISRGSDWPSIHADVVSYFVDECSYATVITRVQIVISDERRECMAVESTFLDHPVRCQ